MFPLQRLKKVITNINIKTKLCMRKASNSTILTEYQNHMQTLWEAHRQQKDMRFKTPQAQRQVRSVPLRWASLSTAPASWLRYHTGHLHGQQQSSKENHLRCELKGRDKYYSSMWWRFLFILKRNLLCFLGQSSSNLKEHKTHLGLLFKCRISFCQCKVGPEKLHLLRVPRWYQRCWPGDFNWSSKVLGCHARKFITAETGIRGSIFLFYGILTNWLSMSSEDLLKPPYLGLSISWRCYNLK